MLDFLKNKKDKSRFSLLYKIVKSKDLKFATDNKSYFIAESGDGKPIWIWVSCDFDFQNANELLFVLIVWRFALLQIFNVCKDLNDFFFT